MTVKITTFEGLRGDLHSDVLSVRNSAIDQAVTMLYESDDMQCGMACAIDELSMSVTRLTSERDAALTRLAELEGLMENAYNRALNQDKRITRLEAEVAALRELLAGNEEVLEMTKIAVIRNCSQCPHSMMVTLGIGSDSRNGWICAHLGFPRKHRTDAESEVQWDTIDARCPLPDAPAWPVVQSDDEERDPGTALESAR